MYEPALLDFFRVDDCDLCGDCLRMCPELSGRVYDYTGVVRRLIEGDDVPEVLDRCSSCMTCSIVCPRDCNPYGLILYRWFVRNRAAGYPQRASLVMPLEPGNAWHRVMDNLPPDEEDRLRRWSDLERPELDGKALFAGCNLQILPSLAGSSLIEGLPVYGRPDLCCGEVYYRMGALDKVQEVARDLTCKHSEFKSDEVVAYCQACYNMMSRILPTHFGAKFPFRLSYFGDLLYDGVMSGEFPVKGKLTGMTVTVHDPCHSKTLGSEFQRRPRAILEHMGCEVVEMRHNREMSLCCGLGHGAARFNPLDMTRGIIKRLREARGTGSDRLVVYCNSCDLILSVGIQVTPFFIPVYHVNELVQIALGEPLPHRNLSRARSMVRELFFKGAPKLLSGKRFQPAKEVSYRRL